VGEAVRVTAGRQGHRRATSLQIGIGKEIGAPGMKTGAQSGECCSTNAGPNQQQVVPRPHRTLSPWPLFRLIAIVLNGRCSAYIKVPDNRWDDVADSIV
jgi:hypothetical protein